jgi:hypothetical protein
MLPALLEASSDPILISENSSFNLSCLERSSNPNPLRVDQLERSQANDDGRRCSRTRQPHERPADPEHVEVLDCGAAVSVHSQSWLRRWRERLLPRPLRPRFHAG